MFKNAGCVTILHLGKSTLPPCGLKVVIQQIYWAGLATLKICLVFFILNYCRKLVNLIEISIKLFRLYLYTVDYCQIEISRNLTNEYFPLKYHKKTTNC